MQAVVVVKSGSKGKETFQKPLLPLSVHLLRALLKNFLGWFFVLFWCYQLVADAFL